MQQESQPAPLFTVELTDAEVRFLLYTLGYMLSAADRMNDGHKFLIEENHYSILPKLIGCTKKPQPYQQTKTMGKDQEDGISGPVLPMELVELIKKLEEEAACKAYTTYCAAVGGKAFNGDPLPNWEALMVTACADEKKAKVVEGWRAAANATVAFSLRKFLISADKFLMAAVDKTAAPSEPATSEATTTPAPVEVPVATDNSQSPA